MATKYSKCPKNRQNDLKYTNIFLCKTLQTLPKWGFWFEKYAHLATLLQSSTNLFQTKICCQDSRAEIELACFNFLHKKCIFIVRKFSRLFYSIV
jgi:hypothetical protein